MSKPLFTSLVAALFVLLAGTVQAADKAPLRIAVIDPLSGPMASIGIPALEQLRFDAKRINKEGGINGHEIEIVRFDNKLDPKESLVQLQKAISGNVRYVAQMGGDAVASALLNAIDKHNERNPNDRVLYLNYGANGPQFTNQRCSFWHFLFDANTEMKMNTLTDWVAKQKDIQKVYVMNPDYSFGHDVSKYTREMLKAKRPDIQIVGNVFVQLGQVKDFSPYVSQIKASGADVVITGNWGQDMTLLTKATASYGLNIPLVTLYANSPGTATAVGEKGINSVHLVSLWNGDYEDADMAKREVEMKEETGYDYGDLRMVYMLEMLKKAAEKADSIDPTKVAFALEGLTYDASAGTATMRAEDHQILVPLFTSVFTNDMKYGLERTDHLNFRAIDTFPAEQTAMSTTCEMRRPER